MFVNKINFFHCITNRFSILITKTHYLHILSNKFGKILNHDCFVPCFDSYRFLMLPLSMMKITLNADPLPIVYFRNIHQRFITIFKCKGSELLNMPVDGFSLSMQLYFQQTFVLELWISFYLR